MVWWRGDGDEAMIKGIWWQGYVKGVQLHNVKSQNETVTNVSSLNVYGT